MTPFLTFMAAVVVVCLWLMWALDIITLPPLLKAKELTPEERWGRRKATEEAKTKAREEGRL